MTNPIPTLSSQGLVADPIQKIDRLLAYLLVADANQSYVYKGRVLTFAKLREEYYTLPDVFATQLREAVTDYLRGHFEQVSVSATATDPEGNGYYQIDLVIRVTDSSQEFSSSWTYSSRDSKFAKAAAIANTGYFEG